MFMYFVVVYLEFSLMCLPEFCIDLCFPKQINAGLCQLKNPRTACLLSLIILCEVTVMLKDRFFKFSR